MLDKWESTSKDDRGVVHVETIGYNQDGTVVCIFRRKVMVPKETYLRRAAASSRAVPSRKPTDDSMTKAPASPTPVIPLGPNVAVTSDCPANGEHHCRVRVLISPCGRPVGSVPAH